jgi:hypothetical protein
MLQSRGDLPPRDRCIVLLAGDLHDSAGVASVDAVWDAFAEVCEHVIGVAGNHDQFDRPPRYLLDGSSVSVAGLVFGGVSGIISNRPGAWHRTQDDYLAAVRTCLDHRPDVTLLHDGPNIAGTGLTGWPAIRTTLEAAPPTLVIRGHDHWQRPLAELSNTTQVLNVEGRVVVLQRGHH